MCPKVRLIDGHSSALIFVSPLSLSLLGMDSHGRRGIVQAGPGQWLILPVFCPCTGKMIIIGSIDLARIIHDGMSLGR